MLIGSNHVKIIMSQECRYLRIHRTVRVNVALLMCMYIGQIAAEVKNFRPHKLQHGEKIPRRKMAMLLQLRSS